VSAVLPLKNSNLWQDESADGVKKSNPAGNRKDSRNPREVMPPGREQAKASVANLLARNSAWPSPGRHDGSWVRVFKMNNESFNIEIKFMQGLIY
jgi:hypothetical protein